MLTRRSLVQGAAGLTLAGMSSRAIAQPAKEIVVGALFPMSGPSGQVGVDARHALETAIDVINNKHDIDLPLAGGEGLPELGGAKIRLVLADHQGDPQKGRAEAERIITQDQVVAIIGTYQSAVAATASQSAERYGVPFLSADNSSPTLNQRGLKYFFRAAAHDDMNSVTMFDFLDKMKKSGQTIETIALFYEDTIFGTDSAKAQRKIAEERGYKIAADIKYRANSPSLTAEVQQLKNAHADVLLPSSYTTDSILLVKTMAELGYKPNAILAQAAGFSDQAFYNAVGPQVQGAITRANFALDLAAKRPSVAKVNELFKARAGKDLNDNSSREFMAMIILADAINRAKSIEGAKLRDALINTNIPGERTIMPWKRVMFDSTGQNTEADAVLQQWVKTSFVSIYPEQAKVADPIWPMPKS